MISTKIVDNFLKLIKLGIVICSVVISGCRPAIKPESKATPVKIEPKLELDNLTFEQVDKSGKPMWKVRAKKGVYASSQKSAKVSDLEGDFYQDGQIVIKVTAKTGEIQQEGEKILLRGDVLAKETRNNLSLAGQEVEWQPKLDTLRVKDSVQANHPQLQANAALAEYFSRKQQIELLGKITAFTADPRLAMQTEHLTWLIKDQKVIGDRSIKIQRYEGQQITAQVTANSSTTKLDLKIVDLVGNVQLNATKPLIQVNGTSFNWQIDKQIVTTNQPLKIIHQQEQVTFTANSGQVNFANPATATLAGNTNGFATRNQANLLADKLVWEMNNQQVIGTGNVVYQQTTPQIKFIGTRGVGKLQDQSIVVSSDRQQQVKTEIIPDSP